MNDDGDRKSGRERHGLGDLTIAVLVAIHVGWTGGAVDLHFRTGRLFACRGAGCAASAPSPSEPQLRPPATEKTFEGDEARQIEPLSAMTAAGALRSAETPIRAVLLLGYVLSIIHRQASPFCRRRPQPAGYPRSRNEFAYILVWQRSGFPGGSHKNINNRGVPEYE
jgi:hypothetical protein